MTTPLLGQMMDVPLTVSSLLAHAARHFGDTEIVSRRIEGDVHRYTYRDCEKRAKQLAQALIALGVQPGERVATLAWNGYRHLEAYYGTTGFGAVCHTINPRLFPDQIAYIVNHADDATCCSTPRSRRSSTCSRRNARKCAAGSRWPTRRICPSADMQTPVLSYETLLRRTTATTTGRRSTNARPLTCATPPARPAIRRARCIRIARPCCMRSARRCPTR